MAGTQSHLRRWWTDDPADPGRLLLADPDVRRLVDTISPGDAAVDLGGVMSLNAHLPAAGLVLRVHQPFVSRARLLALQSLRRELLNRGVMAAEPVAWRGAHLLRLRNRWAELEQYVPHTPLARSKKGYQALFSALGQLHRVLHEIRLAVPRPLVATYASPRSLRRWLRVTEVAVPHDPTAAALALRVQAAVRGVVRIWVPPAQLPQGLIHGDGSPRNIGRCGDGGFVYFDWGFCAQRPRVYELAYALAFRAVWLWSGGSPAADSWDGVQALVRRWEAGAQVALRPVEWQALPGQIASSLLYAAALDGYTEDPAGRLKGRERFVTLAEQVLAGLAVGPRIIDADCRGVKLGAPSRTFRPVDAFVRRDGAR